MIPFRACWARLTGVTGRPVPVPTLSVASEVLPLPSGPQMTSKMGKSFAQLLTSRAVLMAVGLAGDGGGRGRTLWTGAVEVRRRGGAGGLEPLLALTAGEAPAGDEMSLEEAWGVSFCGLNVDDSVGDCGCVVGFCDGKEGNTGVEGSDTGLSVDAGLLLCSD